MGFDLVVGNPPYNIPGKTGTGNTIWQHFVKKSLDEWVRQDGYLSFVHPPGWRKPTNDRSKYRGMFELMIHKNQMVYLEMHDPKDGMSTFRCGTRYDWYLIEKRDRYKPTVIKDEIGKVIELDMSIFKWLPNYDIDKVIKLLNISTQSDSCNILYDCSNHETRKKWVSKTKSDEFKYPLIHSTPKKGIRYMYSKSNDRGHFGISKVIFGESGIYDAVIDMEGIYGMTQGAMAIQVDDHEEALQIKQALESESFKNILKACSWGNYRIDWRMFKDFRKNFWKEFV